LDAVVKLREFHWSLVTPIVWNTLAAALMGAVAALFFIVGPWGLGVLWAVIAFTYVASNALAAEMAYMRGEREAMEAQHERRVTP
jgi:high-affinity nickel permease